MSEIDLARKIFNSSMYAANGGSNSRYQTGSYSTGSSTGNSGTFGSSSTRKGTVISVDGNMAEVRLDGSSATIRGNIETPVAVGQRVSAIFDGRTYVFVALSEFVTQTQNKFLEIAENLQETKDEILADVADDIASVNDSVTEAVSKADEAAQKADAASSSVTEITTTVNGLEEEVAGYSTQISSAVETANSALSQATAAQTDLNGFKTTVSQTYSTKTELDDAIEQEVLDRNSAITQSANSIKSEVSETYQVKGDYATDADIDSAIAQEVLDRNSAIEQSASEITSTVSQNYQSKTDAGTMEQELQAQITQNANAIQTEVTNRTQAVSNAITESKSYTDQQADSITQTVETNVMDTVGQTYATKTELEQAEDSITATVEESVMDEVGNTYATKTELQQTSSGLSVTIEGMQGDIDDAAKTATNYLSYTSEGLELSQSSIDNALLLTPSAFELRQSGTPMTKIAPQKVYLGDPSYGVTVLSDSSLKLYDSAWEEEHYPTYEEWEQNNSPIVTLGANNFQLGGTAVVGGTYVGLDITTSSGSNTVYSTGQAHVFRASGNDTLTVMNNYVSVDGDLYIDSSSKAKLGNGYLLQGAITRKCASDRTLTGDNTIVPFTQTIEEFDPHNLLYASSNYIRVQKPSDYSTIYVEVSFNVQLNGLVAGQNASAQLYKGTTASTTACTIQMEVLQTPGGGFANLTLPPLLVPCTSTYTYLFVKAKCTGGGATIQGGSDYPPFWTVRIVGAE